MREIHERIFKITGSSQKWLSNSGVALVLIGNFQKSRFYPSQVHKAQVVEKGVPECKALSQVMWLPISC